MAKTVAEYKRRWYYDHKAKGLCVSCNEKATNGTLCDKHTAYQNAAKAKRAAERKAHGVCVSCRSMATDGIYCDKHAQTNRESSIRYWHSKNK